MIGCIAYARGTLLSLRKKKGLTVLKTTRVIRFYLAQSLETGL